jgi:N-acetylglutamate synthase-like GNAT family acetyltransferase
MDAPTIRPATPRDLAFLAALQRQHSNAVGYLPRAALAEYVDNAAATIGEHNGQEASYLLARRRLAWQPLMRSIAQAAVHFDAQRRGLGLALVENLCAEAQIDGQLAVQANCRDGLDANEFWVAAGFVAVARLNPANARNRDVIVWRRPLIDAPPRWFYRAPKRAGWKAKKVP